MKIAKNNKAYDSKTHPQLAKWMTRAGLAEIKIADELGISIKTFRKWKKEHREFADSLKEGKEYIDSLVEDALFKRAFGYEVEEVKTFIEELADGRTKKKVEKNKKYIAPDVQASKFWLMNRQPVAWKEKVEVNTNDTTNPLIVDLTQAIKEASDKYGYSED